MALSGGPDSTALTVLADGWAKARGGTVLALVVDHGLRAGSASEAALTMERITARGIAAKPLVLRGLTRGPALAARARAARYAALEAACAEAGIVHLLLGHHALDQAETCLIRAGAGSGSDGRAGMAAIVERQLVRLLRPLLPIAPARLRATARAAGVAWVEDPSNRDPAALRTRVRATLADHGDAIATAIADAAARGIARRAREADASAWLARHAEIHPAGFVLLRADAAPPLALAAAAAAVAGRGLRPSSRAVATRSATLAASTFAGARIVSAGSLAQGAWLVIREAAAMAGEIAAHAGAVWDGRFRLLDDRPDLTLGALGAEAARFRTPRVLPSSVLRTLPALRRGCNLCFVPHLDWCAPGFPGSETAAMPRIVWAPPLPIAGAPFTAAP